MEELSIANYHLNAAINNNDRDLEAQMTKLDNKENRLKERLNALKKRNLISPEPI